MMKKNHRRPSTTLRRLATAGLLAGALLPTASCLALVGIDQGMVTITSAVQANSVGIACQQQDIPNGTLDLRVLRGYQAGLRLRTNLPATFNTQSLQQDQQRSFNYRSYGNADSNIVTIDRAYVYLRDGDASERVFQLTNPNTWTPPSNDGNIPGLPAFDRPRVTSASGVVFNEQTNLGNETIIYLPALTVNEATVLRNGPIGTQLASDPRTRKTIIANVLLEGVTSGGGYVSSNEFSLPIDLCYGCLVAEDCQPPEVLVGNNCALPGQDQPATCQEIQ